MIDDARVSTFRYGTFYNAPQTRRDVVHNLFPGQEKAHTSSPSTAFCPIASDTSVAEICLHISSLLHSMFRFRFLYTFHHFYTAFFIGSVVHRCIAPLRPTQLRPS